MAPPWPLAYELLSDLSRTQKLHTIGCRSLPLLPMIMKLECVCAEVKLVQELGYPSMIKDDRQGMLGSGLGGCMTRPKKRPLVPTVGETIWPLVIQLTLEADFDAFRQER